MSFLDHQPSLDAYWRAVVLLGKNSASYKFALASALLELADGGLSSPRLEDVALPFAKSITRHLALADRQATSRSSRYLDTCRRFNRGEIDQSELIEQTLRDGFTYVLEAFHVVNNKPLEIRFFEVDAQRKTLSLTGDFGRLREAFQFRNLPAEVEARWRLVETAWELSIAAPLLRVEYEAEHRSLFVNAPTRRVSVTSCRDALNGYQKGRCFYCFRQIAIASDVVDADVDHFFPHTLRFAAASPVNLNGVWNLVLACRACNRGHQGKFALVPETRLLERLPSVTEIGVGQVSVRRVPELDEQCRLAIRRRGDTA